MLPRRLSILIGRGRGGAGLTSFRLTSRRRHFSSTSISTTTSSPPKVLGLMSDKPLTITSILDHAVKWHPDEPVVSRTIEDPEGPFHRYTSSYTSSSMLMHDVRLRSNGDARQPRV